MNILQDWRFWLFIISLCQMCLMTYWFIIIKFNDFKHLGQAVTDIAKDVKELTEKVIGIDKNQAVNSAKIKSLENVVK